MKSESVLAILALASIAIGGLTGCAAHDEEPLTIRVDPSRRLPMVGNQGASWELVFPTPKVELARTDGSAADGSDFTRRDAALGVGSQGARLALDSWTDVERPSLRESRQINIPSGHNRFLYFERPGERGYGGHHGHGGYGQPPWRPAHPYGHQHRSSGPPAWDRRSWW